MKDIKQLVIQDDKANIFPRTYLEAVRDRESGVVLPDILSTFNMYLLPWQGSVAETRCYVPPTLRQRGVWVTYINSNGYLFAEYYNGIDIQDTAWADSGNWVNTKNNLVGDISVSASGTWVINGEDTGIDARGEQGETPQLRLNEETGDLEYRFSNTNWLVLINKEEIRGWAATINVGTVTVVKGASPKVTNSGDEHDTVLDFILPDTNTVDVGTTTVVKGVSPKVTNSGTKYDAVFDFTLPDTNTVNVGTTTVVKGASPEVTNSGTEYDAVFDFTLPDTNTINVGTTTIVKGASPEVTNSGTEYDAVLDFTLPDTNTVDVDPDTVTLTPGSAATVVNTGTVYDAKFKFSIPKGDTGDGLFVMGTYESESALRAGVTNPDDGDCYLVESGDDDNPYYVYIYTDGDWVNAGAINSAKIKLVQTTGQSVSEAMSQKAVTDELENLNNMLVALAAGVAASASVSPSVIYKDTATSVTITGRISGETADTIDILEDSSSGTVIKTATNTTSTSVTKTYTLTGNTKTFYAKATCLGMTFTASATLNARYPIYYGFGSSASDAYSSGTKLSARTSAATTYSANATADGQHFYILVPTDISALSSFTMGGAPYVMNSTTETLGDISYRVYESGATYNTGAEVSVTAS